MKNYKAKKEHYKKNLPKILNFTLNLFFNSKHISKYEIIKFYFFENTKVLNKQEYKIFMFLISKNDHQILNFHYIRYIMKHVLYEWLKINMIIQH